MKTREYHYSVGWMALAGISTVAALAYLLVNAGAFVCAVGASLFLIGYGMKAAVCERS